MRITIPDAIIDHYQAHADRQGRTLDQTVTAQLARFRELPPGAPAVIVGGDLLARIETYLGAGPIADGTDLAAKVERLAGVTFHGVHLDFSPSQLEELKYRAERQGRTVESLCVEIVKQMQEQWFWGAGAGEAAVVKATA